MKEKTKNSRYYIVYCILFIFLSSILFYSIYRQYHTLQVSILALDSELENEKKVLAELQKKERVKSYLLEDIHSRLELANFELAVLHNVKAAIYLLRITERMMKRSQDLVFFGLQKSINKKIMDLQAIPVFDIESVLLRIGKISDEIEALPVIKAQVKQPIQVTVVNSDESTWKMFLIAVMQTLRESIIIRRHVLPPTPLLPPTEQAYLVINIRSQLAQASWAVLHHQPMIYERAISQAILWIKQYYREDLEAVQGVLQRLDALQKVDVRLVLSDIDDILKQLDELPA